MTMAAEEQVKRYLAYWFQLGKRILLPNRQKSLRPTKIFEGDSYSAEFERCWQQILSMDADCYLEGTEQTIQQLLSPNWEIDICARCQMPVPVIKTGIQPAVCPCFDLPTWPNLELPMPRSPVKSLEQLNKIQQRLRQQPKE